MAVKPSNDDKHPSLIWNDGGSGIVSAKCQQIVRVMQLRGNWVKLTRFSFSLSFSPRSIEILATAAAGITLSLSISPVRTFKLRPSAQMHTKPTMLTTKGGHLSLKARGRSAFINCLSPLTFCCARRIGQNRQCSKLILYAQVVEASLLSLLTLNADDFFVTEPEFWASSLPYMGRKPIFFLVKIWFLLHGHDEKS